MGFLDSVILGIVQGLTEFLPVSSSGHLVLVQNLLGLNNIDVLFDIFLHLGTLAAVIIFLRKDLCNIVLNLGRLNQWRTNPEIKMLYLIVVASVPTALIGFLFKDYFEKMFTSMAVVGCFLIVTGFLLFLAERFSVSGKNKNVLVVTAGDALIIGLMQGLAIAPGISRSGATISAGLWRGMNRELAARFSFLLSIPAILGASAFKIKDYKQMAITIDRLPLIMGTIMAFFSGYLALAILFRIIRTRKLDIFSYYCWLVGLVVVVKYLLF
ncbi:MAG: undecaprenyl-diphosphatase UppP [bacterium]